MHRRRASAAILALSLAAALLIPPPASFGVSGGDADAARKRADDARRKQAVAEAQADRLVSETKALESTISRTRGEISLISGKVDTAESRRAGIEAEMAALRSEIASKRSLIASTTAAYRDRRELLGRRAESVYRQGDLYWLQLLLESRSITDLIARTSFVEQVMQQDTSMMASLADTRGMLERANAELDRSVQALAAKRAEAAAEENGLRQLQSDRASRLAEQRGAQAAKESLLAETKGNIAKLRAIVAAEEAEAARIERLLRSSASHGNGRYAGTLTWPTPGYETITSPFGWRIHPILKTRKFHSGIDIRAPYGAKIVAAGNGTVIFAGDRGGYGNVVMIDHGNGLVTVYAHQSSVAVSPGTRVRQGQKIGEVGSTGLSTGPHLHFEVRVNGDPRDPMGYL
ncbi:MAG TPA: peptidoglycan DD-metalloendopeptidase family protein [Coriobacteriia bacterium]|jgi:murein DD-endopeptidase MepM/ murein hydrolase activator NlpD